MRLGFISRVFATGLFLSTCFLAFSTELSALNGEWIYCEDITPGKSLEQMSPPMTSKFSFRAEEDVMILVSGHGSGRRDVRVKLDGSATELKSSDATTVTKYTAKWQDPIFSYQTESFRNGSATPISVIKKSFEFTSDGLIVRVAASAFGNSENKAIYRHAQDIPMPTPVKAVISDLAWLTGNWVGTRGTSGTTTIEERWGPAKGGSLFAISRTVSRDRLSAFEFLRILERNGSLVYTAQPNGGTATEFLLTEISTTRVVFENPRHDYPKRITYELSADGTLTATIGQLKGGTPPKFVFAREKE